MNTATTQDPPDAPPSPNPGQAVGSNVSPLGSTSAVVGLQWGDEGKGKVIDLIAGSFDAVVRYNGGANAGHSVVIEGKRHAFHLLPSGVFHEGVRSVIANGVVVDPWVLAREIEAAQEATGREVDLVISSRAHVVLPYHKIEDERREAMLSGGGSSIGTTKRGIGPAYSDKAQRSTAVRMGDLARPDVLREKLARIVPLKERLIGALADEPASIDVNQVTDDALAIGAQLAPRITDTTYLLNEMHSSGKALLFEGANATLLDVDHGTYPFVTSSSTMAQGISSGTGVAPHCIGRVIGVMKAYSTRVGAGPFPTELDDDIGNRIRDRGNEYGTTTGRPRRCGWIDLVALRYAVMLNGCSGLALTLLDVLSGFDQIMACTKYRLADGTLTDRFLPDAFDLDQVQPIFETLPGFSQEITGARAWDDLPGEAKAYVEFLEKSLGVPIEIIGVGPDRAQTIRR